MFVRNAWYVAAARDEVTDNLLARRILNEPVVLLRGPDGTPAALEDRCCHRGAPLSLGVRTETGLRCGYHGFAFDRTGVCIDIPGARGRIPERARVKSYPVFERGDYVWIWMGDPKLARSEDVIDHAPDDPQVWPRLHDMLPVKASYVMVLENLMDLSHLSYLHRSSIGSAPEDSEAAQMDVTRTPRGVKFMRLMLDAACPPRIGERFGFTGRVDRWSEFEYIGPSAIVQWSGIIPAGDYASGVRDGGHQVRVLHAVTPETERSSHYFFAIADGGRKYEPAGARNAVTAIKTVFEEDVLMLEQQQARLEGHDLSKLLDGPSDVARVQMIRVLNQMIEDDRQGTQVVAQ
jgi:vanillate O-demethylase monooxygenase subunit